MPKTRIQKEETVSELKDKLSRAKLVAFADYRGLTMSQLSDLRKKLREADAEFIVTKNTLLKLSIPTSNFQLPTSSLEGPTATLFSYEDEISPLKVLVKALKDAGLGNLKGGFMGEIELDTVKLTQLSTLPTKEELRAKTVGVLVAPLHGIVGVLNANLRNLVYALDQIRITKGGV